MLGRTYEGQNCSIARALEVVGERWTLLILRDACVRDVRRFVDFQRSLGIARNVLAARLRRLCDEGLLEHDGGDYVPTPMAAELFPVLVSLMRWGDRHYAPAGPPGVLHHTGCGGEPVPALTCGGCGQDVGLAEVRLTAP